MTTVTSDPQADPASGPLSSAEALERELDELTRATGLERRQIGIRDVDWGQYLKAGVLVKLSVHQPVVATKTTLQDLGIEPQSQEEREAIERTQILGYGYLVPKRIQDNIARIMNAGRSNVTQFSIPTSWGNFIPQGRYLAWAAKNAELRAEYLRVADDLYENWDRYYRETEVDYLIQGRANYRRLRADGVQIDEDVDRWASDFAVRKMSKLKSREICRRRFDWVWSTDYVPVGRNVERALLEMIDSDDPMLRDLARTSVRQQGQGATQLGQELTGAIRSMVYDTICNALESMQRNKGELTGGSVGALRRLIEKVRLIQFWPDAELDTKLDEIRVLIDVAPASRSDGDVKRAMTELGNELWAYLLEIDRPPERDASDLGLAPVALDLGLPAARGADPAPAPEGLTLPPPTARSPFLDTLPV